MIYTIAQIKGGVGKSTIVVNLAAFFAQTGYKTGILDTDSNRTAWNWWQRRIEEKKDASEIECQFVQGDIKDTLQAMNKRNDIVIVDTAGFSNVSMGPAIVNSDIVIFPFAPKQYDLEVTQRLLNQDSLVTAQMLNPRVKLRAVLNNCPTNARDQRANDAENYLKNEGLYVYISRLTRRDAYADSGQMGIGVSEFEDDRAAVEISNLGKEVLNDG